MEKDEAEGGPAAESQIPVWQEALRTAQDLPPEGASEEELAACEALRALVLQKQGRDGPFEDWRHSLYIRHTLLRFLRARQGDVEAAASMLVAAAQWMEDQDWWGKWLGQFERDDPRHKELIDSYDAQGFYGTDRRGAPVLYYKAGKMDIAGMLRETDKYGGIYVRRYCYRTLQQGLHELLALGHAKGEHHMGVNIVMDWTDVRYSTAVSLARMVIWVLSNVQDERFPEMTRKIFFVNLPWDFLMLWTLVSPFLSARTKEKIHFCQGNFIDELTEEIDIGQIPEFLGGSCPEPWAFGDGGDVPDTDGETPTQHHDINVSSDHRIQAEVPAGKSCVWEFRVMDHDIKYTVTVCGKTEEIVVEEKLVYAEDGWERCTYENTFDYAVTVCVSFDNSYSWLRTKDIQYKIEVVQSSVDEFARMAGSSAAQAGSSIPMAFMDPAG